MTPSRNIVLCPERPPEEGGALSSAAKLLFTDNRQLFRTCDIVFGSQIIPVLLDCISTQHVNKSVTLK